MEALVAFDQQISMALNSLVGRSTGLDFLIYGITTLNLTKFVPLYALLWGLWFRPGPRQEQDREAIVMVFLSVLITMVLARLSQNAMPERPRPIHEPAIDFRPPDAFDPTILTGWSSFPSDHAGVVGALAVGILFVSVPWGLLAGLWGLLVICLPRVYSGMHYVGDITVGFAVGAVIALVVMRLRLPEPVRRLPAQIELNHPVYFYAVAFIGTYLFATLMDDVRKVGEAVERLLF